MPPILIDLFSDITRLESHVVYLYLPYLLHVFQLLGEARVLLRDTFERP